MLQETVQAVVSMFCNLILEMSCCTRTVVTDCLQQNHCTVVLVRVRQKGREGKVGSGVIIECRIISTNIFFYFEK